MPPYTRVIADSDDESDFYSVEHEGDNVAAEFEEGNALPETTGSDYAVNKSTPFDARFSETAASDATADPNLQLDVNFDAYLSQASHRSILSGGPVRQYPQFYEGVDEQSDQLVEREIQGAEAVREQEQVHAQLRREDTSSGSTGMIEGGCSI